MKSRPAGEWSRRFEKRYWGCEIKRTTEDIREKLGYQGCDNETALEMLAEIDRLRDVVNGAKARYEGRAGVGYGWNTATARLGFHYGIASEASKYAGPNIEDAWAAIGREMREADEKARTM